MVNSRQKVNCNLLTDRMVRVQEVDGCEIVVIEVPRADRRHRPVYVGTDPMRGTYRRNFEGDYLCTTEEVAAMYRDASDVTLDQRVLVDMDVDVIDVDTLHRYRNRFAQFHAVHKWNDEVDDVFMRRIGAVALSTDDRQFHPTLAGLLMFGHEYDIVRECPHYFLDYQEQLATDARWSHRLVSTSGDWSGNLYDFFFSVYPRLVSDLPKPFVTDGLNRLEETPLHLALREVLLNQLAHADHYGRQGIVVIKTRDAITLSNPGDIRIGLDVALEGGVSDPRNETIMKMFSLIEIGERAGSGIPDFTNTWETYEGEIPQYRVSHQPDRTTLTIPCRNLTSQEVVDKVVDKRKVVDKVVDNRKVVDKVVDKQEIKQFLVDKWSITDRLAEHLANILQLIREQRIVTSDDVVTRLNLNATSTKRYLRRLVDMGLVASEGGNRNRVYKAH
jgi:predicted HTH transcriptional regulator